MNKLHLVVSRYKEDVSWVDELNRENKDLKVTIYNKFEGENLLPNLGREAHTYIHHIIENYQNVDDHYMFLQGNPFDHENPKGIIRDIVKNYNNYCQYDYYPLNVELLKDLNGLPASRRQGFPVGFLYEKIFGEGSSPQVFESPQGAQFLIKGNLFHRLSLFQWNLLKQLVSHSSNPIEAHCIEKMWKCLFLGKSNKTYKDIFYDKYPHGYLEKISNEQKVTMLSPWATSLGYDI